MVAMPPSSHSEAGRWLWSLPFVCYSMSETHHKHHLSTGCHGDMHERFVIPRWLGAESFGVWKSEQYPGWEFKAMGRGRTQKLGPSLSGTAYVLATPAATLPSCLHAGGHHAQVIHHLRSPQRSNLKWMSAAWMNWCGCLVSQKHPEHLGRSVCGIEVMVTGAGYSQTALHTQLWSLPAMWPWAYPSPCCSVNIDIFPAGWVPERAGGSPS